jgi:outer membrane protein assembly factor BamB
MIRSSLFTLWLTTTTLTAADWPQLLGPTRDGVIEPPAEKKLIAPQPVWDREIGTGFAGPAVAEGKVIITHRLGDELVVEAVDATTGILLWSFKRPTDYVDSFGFDNGPRSVPAIAAGRIFVHGADGVLDALDLETGKALWQVDTVKDYESPQGFFGRACSPLVLGNRVIITPGGSRDGKPAGVVAFDVASGQPLWQSVADEAGYASPMAIGSDQLLCWLRNELWLLDSATGKVIAQRRLRSDTEASVNASQPVLLSGNRVLLSAGYDVGLHVWQLPTLKPLWNKEGLLDCHYGTPVIEGDTVFGFDGRQERGQTLRSIDLTTQTKHWQSPPVPGGTLIRVGSHLLAVTEQGELWVIPTTAKTFDPLHQTQILRSGHRSHLAFSDGLLFARDGQQLIAVKVFE